MWVLKYQQVGFSYQNLIKQLWNVRVCPKMVVYPQTNGNLIWENADALIWTRAYLIHFCEITKLFHTCFLCFFCLDQ